MFRNSQEDGASSVSRIGKIAQVIVGWCLIAAAILACGGGGQQVEEEETPVVRSPFLSVFPASLHSGSCNVQDYPVLSSNESVVLMTGYGEGVIRDGELVQYRISRDSDGGTVKSGNFRVDLAYCGTSSNLGQLPSGELTITVTFEQSKKTLWKKVRVR